ncbi:phytochelatin synthase family protein [uncultured Hyphomonas sp.]|uniref:phytochelatin synthase family protein n=1 Tax=uncultured Hyphomonas sp. TaxID=225298 RepID=UPI00374814CC
MEKTRVVVPYRVRRLVSRLGYELTDARRQAPPPAAPMPLDLPPNLVSLDTAEGTRLLREADAIADYVPLSMHFVTQESPTFCGPASMTMVLNALGIARPGTSHSDQHGLFDQDNVFTRETHSITPRAVIRRFGTPLSTLGQFFEAHGVRAATVYASTVSVASFRETARRVLETSAEYIVVNYNRAEVGQLSGGHISPVAAYHADTDMFLILDVSRYKYPPFWITADELFGAMNVKTGAGITHGYVIVGRKTN